MLTCKKCNKIFPIWAIIQGERKNLSHRKFCLECSPYKQHNTRDITKPKYKRPNGGQAVSRRRKKLKLLAVELLGGKCSKCGYSKCITALEFHHVNPKLKEFSFGSKGLTRSWGKIKKELAKCILVCANCHREIESKMIPI